MGLSESKGCLILGSLLRSGLGAAAAGSSLGPCRAFGMAEPVRPVPGHSTESDFVTVNSCCKKCV